MGSPTTPTQGKYAELYVLRPNGFSGVGLNDLTWGLAATNAATAYYEVEIDHIGANDTYKWRKNGGAWTEDVAFAAGVDETLDEAQTFQFAAVTGHTVGDRWIIGNLAAEATTEALTTAQITAAGNRLINPNAPPTFTDDGGKTVDHINFTNGTATFSGNVGNVTVAGNNGYLPAAALRRVAYFLGWSLNVTLDFGDSTAAGDAWKSALPGEAGGSGSAEAHFIATETLYNVLADSIAAGDKYFLLQLFNYDPSDNQTGDHITVWVTFTSFALPQTFGNVVKEQINFQIYGEPSFTAAA